MYQDTSRPTSDPGVLATLLITFILAVWLIVDWAINGRYAPVTATEPDAEPDDDGFSAFKVSHPSPSATRRDVRSKGSWDALRWLDSSRAFRFVGTAMAICAVALALSVTSLNAQ